ncbi:hypothetical protein MN0502_10180 [Arthrobacter sp. MN05-02]|nr:hypothetical protein MN0502_10180 [Arthrobacter sp. MN05-02]
MSTESVAMSETWYRRRHAVPEVAIDLDDAVVLGTVANLPSELCICVIVCPLSRMQRHCCTTG